MREIDRSARLPAWKQIAADLREGIADGTWQPDMLLPSITIICQQYGVARTTANKALRQLAAEGLADLEPGRGYYVTGHPEGT